MSAIRVGAKLEGEYPEMLKEVLKKNDRSFTDQLKRWIGNEHRRISKK